MNEKIKGHQLERGAYVYVRQSTPYQVRNHLESKPRLSPQNRPYVISSKPANGIGRRRDCFTLLQRAFARLRIEPSKYCLILWFHSAGVAPCGVIHGR